MNMEEQISKEVEKTLSLLEQDHSRPAPADFHLKVMRKLKKQQDTRLKLNWRVAAMIAFIIANAISYSLFESSSDSQDLSASQTFISSYGLEDQSDIWLYE
jgi:hypothetical protein